MPQFPVLKLIDRHGDWAAAVLATLPLAFVVGVAAIGGSLLWLPAGMAATGVLYVLLRSYVELIRLMIDMLLPK